MARIDSDAFGVSNVTNIEEVADVFGLNMNDEEEAARAGHIYTVLDETDSVAIQLENSWWGNEAFGVWSEWFFVHVDGVSPSGKALFIREGISLNDPVRHLRRAETRSESGNGWTNKAVRRARKKAFGAWDDDYMVGPGGGDGFDSRDRFEDKSTPISVIETAIATPVDTDHLVYDAEGSREGALSDGDVQITGTKRTRYGDKFVLSGDTYGAFKQDEVEDEITFHSEKGRDAHHTYDGDTWVCDLEGVDLVINSLVEAGYSVSVHREQKSHIEDAMDHTGSLAESFGVDV